MQVNVLTRTCKVCEDEKTERDFAPAHWASGRKTCRSCTQQRSNEARWAAGGKKQTGTSRTPEAKAQYLREWHAKNPDARRRLDLKKYDLTPEQYDAMLTEQAGVCAGCERPETRKHPVTGLPVPLAVDHDHETGEVRGLLCSRCNFALGYAQDSAEILRGLASYIEERASSKSTC